MSTSRSKNKKIDTDIEMARRLNEKLNAVGVTENAVFPNDRDFTNYEPKTLIDQTLEIVDPTPNIYTLFGQFDQRFFQGKLVSVEVRWSTRMTSCAGTCTFHGRSRYCVISLSSPLLKLRPRKDLVETLLHEMIHAYLFLTNNNRDRDGHGPEFCKIMNRINGEAGTHISIYHSFHDEVRLYKQHWWRCDGPCHKRPPYFGMVRRAMNRAPGPSDLWWADHQQSCAGRFIKVKEPEKPAPGAKRNGINENKTPKGKSGKPDKKLDNWFVLGKPKTPETNGRVPMRSELNNLNGTVRATGSGLVKLGTSTNNVHGWGIGGPGSSSSSNSSKTPSRQIPTENNSGGTLNFSGAVGGVGTGRSKLLDMFSQTMPKNSTKSKERRGDVSPVRKKSKIVDLTNSNSSPVNSKVEMHHCPVCDKLIRADLLNDHLDVCLMNQNESWDDNEKPEKIINGDGEKLEKVPCPICNKYFPAEMMYDHWDKCAFGNSSESIKKQGSANDPQTSQKKKVKVSNSDEFYVCLVCNLRVNKGIELNDHLEECVQTIFNDDSFDVGNETLNGSSSSIEISSPDKIPSPKSIDLTTEKFPCPVCMTLLEENKMNEHLDVCLSMDE